MIYDRYLTTFAENKSAKYDYEKHESVNTAPSVIQQNIPCNVTTLGLARTMAIFGNIAENALAIRTYQKLTGNFGYIVLNDDKRHYILTKVLNLKNEMYTYIVKQDVTTNE